jgi:hypothetical protein
VAETAPAADAPVAEPVAETAPAAPANAAPKTAPPGAKKP